MTARRYQSLRWTGRPRRCNTQQKRRSCKIKLDGLWDPLLFGSFQGSSDWNGALSMFRRPYWRGAGCPWPHHHLSYPSISSGWTIGKQVECSLSERYSNRIGSFPKSLSVVWVSPGRNLDRVLSFWDIECSCEAFLVISSCLHLPLRISLQAFYTRSQIQQNRLPLILCHELWDL